MIYAHEFPQLVFSCFGNVFVWNLCVAESRLNWFVFSGFFLFPCTFIVVNSSYFFFFSHYYSISCYKPYVFHYFIQLWHNLGNKKDKDLVFHTQLSTVCCLNGYQIKSSAYTKETFSCLDLPHLCHLVVYAIGGVITWIQMHKPVVLWTLSVLGGVYKLPNLLCVTPRWHVCILLSIFWG